MTFEFLIRPASPGDSAALSALATQVWLHTYATSGVSAEMARHVHHVLGVRRFATRIEDSSGMVMVAVEKDCLIGFTVLVFKATMPATSVLPELDMLVVQTHFLRGGIGTALLGAAQQAAAQHTGSSSIRLSVNVKNAGALAFYQSHGFVQEGLVDFYLGSVAHQNLILHGPVGAMAPVGDQIAVVVAADRDAIAALIAGVLHSSVDASAAEKAVFLPSMLNNLDWACHNTEACVHLIYRRSQSVVGVILVKQFGHLCALMVKPEMHRGGIGTALIAHALALCRAHPLSEKVSLNASRNAVGFYLSQGFGIVEGPPAPLGVIPMQIRL